MAAYPRPSLIIRIFVSDRELTTDLSQRLKTTYSYIGGTVVAGFEPQDVDPDAPNALVLDIKLHKPYWDANDPAAQDMWENMMLRWLQNVEYKVGATVANSYKNDEERGDGGVPYRWIEFKFGDNAIVSFETADGLTLPKDALSVIERVRALMSADALGSDVARVRIPQPAAENPGDTQDPDATEPAQAPVSTAWWVVERRDGSEQAFDLEGGCLVEG